MSEAPTRKWKPLNKVDRRVLGVLIEKAKTTPDQYPLTLNALLNGCNQKSNRQPLMNLEEEDIMRSVDRLRMCGAVAEVQGGGRVPRYRHYGAEWLGVDRIELSIITELLLRGPQTEGSLRANIARMDQVADLDQLRQLLNQLMDKQLIASFTPAGRGHVVGHLLYEPQEIAAEKAHFAAQSAVELSATEPAEETVVVRSKPITAVGGGSGDAALRGELQTLREELRALRDEFDSLREEHRAAGDELRRLRDALGG